MWIFLAFCSALFAGLTTILAKIGIKNTDSSLATAIRTAVILVFSWLIVLISGSQKTIPAIESKTLIFLALSGLATGASWLLYFKGLQLGDVNKVTPIDKSSTVLSMIFAFVLLGEPVTISKVSGLILIGIGTYLVIAKKQTDKGDTKSNKWLVYAGLSAVCAALTSILGKIGIQNVDSNLGTAIRTVVVLILSWFMVFIKGKQRDIKTIDQTSWLFIVLSGITTGLSWLCYYKALQDGQVCIVVPIDKLSILFTIPLAVFILKEKLSKKALAGFAAIVLGTALLFVGM